MITDQHSKSEFLDLSRLIALIDGVFAVALTLLILDLKLPPGNGDLLLALKAMLPSFLVYLIVFTSVAGYWVIHHGNFHHIAHGDGKLVVLSLLNLLFITLVPLTASIVGAHPLDPIATVCFSLNGFFYCLSAWATWTYAGNHRKLLSNEYDVVRLKRVSTIMKLVCIGLAVAIPLAYVSVFLTYAIWIFYTPTVAWWTRPRKKRVVNK
jgi:uncharacterized membrane protein